MFSGREVIAHTWTTWHATRAEATQAAELERGAALVEYAFLLILVAFVGIATLTLFGSAVLELFSETDAQVSALVDSAPN